MCSCDCVDNSCVCDCHQESCKCECHKNKSTNWQGNLIKKEFTTANTAGSPEQFTVTISGD